MAVRKVKYVISMQDKMSRKMKGISGHTNKLNSQLTRVAGSLGLAFGAGIVARNIFKNITEFEKSMAEVKALTRTMGDQFDILNMKAIEMGSTTIFTGKQAADAMGMLARAGFSTNQIMDSVKDTLNLAAAGNLDLATTADIATDVLTAYGMKASELNQITDLMAKTATTSNTTLQLMGDSLRYVAPIAKGFGIEIEEVAMMIGKLGSAGIKGSMAGAQLRMAFSKMRTNSLKKKFAGLGISLEKSNDGLFSMVNLFKEMKLKGLTPEDMTSIFGPRAGTSMEILFRTGAENLEKYLKEVKDNAGEAERLANEMTQNTSDQLKMLSAAWGGLWQTIDSGQGIVSKSMKGITSALTNYIQLLQGMATTVEDLSKTNVAKTLGVYAETSAGMKKEEFLSYYIFQYQKLKKTLSSARVELKKMQDEKIIWPWEATPMEQKRTKARIIAIKEIRKTLLEHIQKMKKIGGTGEDGIDTGGGAGEGGIDTGGGTSTAEGAAEAVEAAEAMTKVSGMKPNYFNINIDSLIENFSVNTRNIKESTGAVKEQVLIALTEALNEAQTIAQ